MTGKLNRVLGSPIEGNFRTVLNSVMISRTCSQVVWLALAVAGLSGCSAFNRTPSKTESLLKVSRGDVVVEVIETGAVEATKVVEVKSRVSGRIKRILVEEGDLVTKGDLIAEIDPEETEFQVEQTRAQLRGAQASIARTTIEIAQRRETLAAQLRQSIIRVEQLRKELGVQPTLTQSAIRGAQAALDVARTTRQQLVVSTHPNERTALQAELDQAKVSLENTKLELSRLRNLLAREFVAQREVDNQQLQVDVAESRMRSVQQRMGRLAQQHQTELRTADDRIRQAEAELTRARTGIVQDSTKAKELESAEAAIRVARAQLKDVDALIASRAQSQATADQISSQLRDTVRQLGETAIRAPIDGIITAKLIQEGELVASLGSFSSGTPVVRLEDRSKMLVRLNMNEIDAAKLKLGMRTRVLIDAIPGREFLGSVTKIAPSKVAAGAGAATADSVVRFAIEVQLEDKDSAVKSGMTAKVTVETLRKNKVLTVPADYLVTEGTNNFLLLPAEKGKTEPRRQKVTIGAKSNASVEIVSGANEGQELVRPKFDGPSRRGFGPNNGGGGR